MRRVVQVGVALWVACGLMGDATAQPATSSESPLKTSQRISLDLKGVDILDVLKLLSQQSGLNFIAGRNVSGRVTIFVNDVDVWEAFELLIGANDLAYEQQGDIVTVMTARDYELIYGEKFQERKETFTQTLQYAKVAQAATVLNQIKSAVGRVVADEATNTLIITDVPARLAEMRELVAQLDRPTETRVYNLNYANAEKLKESVQGLLSPIGTFTFDARTNKVIVSDLKEGLPRIDQLLRAFDSPEGQVLIEAKIVKVDLTNEMDLGIDWQQVLSGVDTTARGNFRVLSDIVGGSATGVALKLLTAPRGNTQVIIEALKKITRTDTLSNPRLMVSNNQEARILVGTREAVVTVTTTVPATGSTVSSPEIQYVDVGTKLYVTPNIKHDGHIQIKIRPEVSSSTVETFQTNRIPIVSSTEAETNVLVKSGSTLIIGGLIETKDTRTDNRVPILGDIPVLGIPFRGSTDIKKKTELVVFLTPQIVLPDGTPSTDPAAALRDSLPPAYRQAVRQRLQDHLASQFLSLSLPKGSVVVSFVLNRDGRFVGSQEVTSPEGEPFVTAATVALAQAQPFPPFPSETPADEVRFRLAVDYAP
ncbi:MAG: TonB C-terminal domain-containing protein [Candidatus Omnitrophica bacterium]|nr:TonB C-terminal domain-containing protein [Candidatus Omnitrophota bacterium]